MERMRKKKTLHFFRVIRRPQKTKYHTTDHVQKKKKNYEYVCPSVPCTRYQVPGTWYLICTWYTAAVLVQSKVSTEPPQHRPSALAASARAALSTPSERRDLTQMPSVLGEARESRQLNNTQPHSNKPQ